MPRKSATSGSQEKPPRPTLATRGDAYRHALRSVSKGTVSRFTEALHDRILTALLERHITTEGAAAMCGVPRGDLHLWLAKGRAGEEPYVTFVRDLISINGMREAALMDQIAKSEDWKASHTLLKLLFADRFAENRTVISLADARIDPKLLTGDEIDTLRRILSKAAGKPVELELSQAQSPPALPAHAGEGTDTPDDVEDKEPTP